MAWCWLGVGWGVVKSTQAFTERSGVEMRAQDVSRSQGAGLKVARHLKASKWDQKKGEYGATET